MIAPTSSANIAVPTSENAESGEIHEVVIPDTEAGNDAEALSVGHASRRVGGRRGSEGARLLICDDAPIFRDGLRSLIEPQPEFCVVGESAIGNEVIELAREIR